jgi:murein DD-endopeptidase MepM/ murein hydrolase activator NlpD
MTSNFHGPSTGPAAGPSAASSARSLWLLRQGIGLVGVVGLLGSQAVFAQSASPTDVAEPSGAADLAPAPVDSVPTDTMILAPDALPATDGEAAESVAEPPGVAPSESEAAVGEAFIDSTHYTLGATERSGDRPTALATPNAVPVGPLAAGEGGFSGLGLATGHTTASGQTYSYAPANVQYYYNRTLRPPGRLGNGNLRLIFPLSMPAPITSMFGWRIHPISGDQRFHSGTDIGAPMGTPVLAAYAGQVAIADFMGGYGLTVTVAHNSATQQTLYGHLSEVFVKPGDLVRQGDVIGRVGSTGNSTGPHLHFEFHQLTSEGWMALDAGQQLEYALAQFMNSMQIGQAGTALGQFNVGLAGSAAMPTLNPATPAAAAPAPVVPTVLPVVTVSKTVYPTVVLPQPTAKVPGLSNQQLFPSTPQKLSLKVGSSDPAAH